MKLTAMEFEQMTTKWRQWLGHLPVLLAVFIEAHIRFFSHRTFGTSHWLMPDSEALGLTHYLLLTIQLFIESLPFFIAAWVFHKFVFSIKSRAFIALVLGFIVYPVVSLIVASNWQAYAEFRLIGPQGWALAFLATLLWWLNRFISIGKNHRIGRWVGRMFSLNGVVCLLLVGWTFMWAGIFHSNPDPMRNMPLNPILDLRLMFTEWPTFLNYLWQFGFIALLTYAFYAVIRFFLIRQLLAKEGVLPFLFGSGLFILIFTPIAGSLILLLPINIETMTLLISTDYDVFAFDNYMYSIVLFLASVPMILSFDRQQQDTLLAENRARQTKTELQLLQQQINPHFLFNTLNNLYALTLKKADSAPDLIMKLADLLRYTVYQGQKDTVALNEEVDYLRNYLDLQHIRLGERCDIQASWPEEKQTEQYQIQPLLFIVLLENAFKHGIEVSAQKSLLVVNLSINDEQTVSFEMLNSTKSGDVASDVESSEVKSLTKANSGAGGLGLINLKRRLNLLFPQRYSLVSEPKDEKTWVTRLTINLRDSDEEGDVLAIKGAQRALV